MENQEQNSEIKEVAPQVTEENESMQAEETHVEDHSQSEKDLEQEKNWRAMRQRQRELEFALKQKEEMLEKFLQSQQPQAPKVEEESFDPDDYANYMGVQKVTKKTVQPLEKKIQDLEAKLAKQEQDKLFAGLRSKYSDFDDVVNIETLELLEKKEPELAATIGELRDPYKIGIQSYKYIKALNLLDDLPSSRRKKEIDKKIEKNSKTVQSPMAYDKRPIAQAFKATAADKKRLYEEMMFYASKATGL